MTRETGLFPFRSSRRRSRRGRLLPGLAFLGLAVGVACLPGGASAGSEPFSEARFRALQQEGALVLVDVSADWCSTCAKQGEIVRAYQEARPDVALHVLRVDFDDQKRWVRHFGAPRQSTLVLFRGDERVWFSVAETERGAIFEALDRGASAT